MLLKMVYLCCLLLHIGHISYSLVTAQCMDNSTIVVNHACITILVKQ